MESLRLRGKGCAYSKQPSRLLWSNISATRPCYHCHPSFSAPPFFLPKHRLPLRLRLRLQVSRGSSCALLCSKACTAGQRPRSLDAKFPDSSDIFNTLNCFLAFENIRGGARKAQPGVVQPGAESPEAQPCYQIAQGLSLMSHKTRGRRHKGRRVYGQAQLENELTYQHNYSAVDLPPSLPPNHYSVHLHRPVTPGVGLTPPVRINLEGLCYDWQLSLGQMQTTTCLLHAKCERELQQSTCHVVPEDTIALRTAVNASLKTQMDYFTRCMAVWTGASPVQAQQPAQNA